MIDYILRAQFTKTKKRQVCVQIIDSLKQHDNDVDNASLSVVGVGSDAVALRKKNKKKTNDGVINILLSMMTVCPSSVLDVSSLVLEKKIKK